MLKVISVGVGGMFAVNHMIDSGVTGAEFISCSRDEMSLQMSKAEKKILLDKNVSYGLDGGSTERSAKAANESREEILSALRGAEAVIIVAGLGGFDGTGASPVVAKFAKELGVLTVALVTLPYRFEGLRRTARAEAALEKLLARADMVVKISNDKVLQSVDKKMKITMTQSFKCVDEIICRAVRNLIVLLQDDDVGKNFSEATPDV